MDNPLRLPDEDLRRFWFVFDSEDEHGCRLPFRCGVTAWNERDALALVGQRFCREHEPPGPRSVLVDFDVSELAETENVRRYVGVPVWRGIWYPFMTSS